MVSAIIPAYNCEKYIRESVDSLLAQSFLDMEIIVVDDGSTDGTNAILKQYGSRIRLFEKKNGGAASARNLGLLHAAGKYVLFLDADDYLEPSCVATAVQLAEEKKVDIVRYGYVFEFPNGVKKWEQNNFPDGLFVEKSEFPRYVYQKMLSGITFNMAARNLFRREILSGITFREDMKTAEDAAFCIEAFTRAQSFFNLSAPFLHYRMTGEGLTGSGLCILEKYKYNWMLSNILVKKLKAWNMDTPANRLKAYFRLVSITIEKLKR